MSKDNKYKMFKEFMYNELGITKEDIKEWTKEAVYETASNYVEHQFSVMELEIENAQLQKTVEQLEESIKRLAMDPNNVFALRAEAMKLTNQERK